MRGTPRKACTHARQVSAAAGKRGRDHGDLGGAEGPRRRAWEFGLRALRMPSCFSCFTEGKEGKLVEDPLGFSPDCPQLCTWVAGTQLLDGDLHHVSQVLF